MYVRVLKITTIIYIYKFYSVEIEQKDHIYPVTSVCFISTIHDGLHCLTRIFFFLYFVQIGCAKGKQYVFEEQRHRKISVLHSLIRAFDAHLHNQQLLLYITTKREGPDQCESFCRNSTKIAIAM